MPDYDKAIAWMKVHRECKGGFITGAWFGMQFADCNDYVNIKCMGCGESYIVDKNGEIGSNEEISKPQKKNLPKEVKHENSVSTRKIRGWKIHGSR